MAPDRPRGVVLLAVYYAALAVALTPLAAYAFYVLRTIPAAFGAFVANPGALLGLAALAAAAHGAAAFALWVLHPWSPPLVLGLAATGALVGVLTLPLGLVAVALNGVTAWYILDPRVRGAFRRAPPWGGL